MTDIDPRSQEHPDHPTLAHKAWLWANDGMLDDVEWDNEAEELGKLLERAMLDLLCARYGHEIEDDQCGMPKHRFCLWCYKRFPDAPIGRQPS